MSEKKKERIFWTEFLELYESLPVLWKVKSDEYKDRVLKAKAYDKMVQKLSEIEENADRDMVRRKINTFRSNYRRDLKRIKQSEKSGSSPDDKYVSSLWYFDKLGFLEDQEDSLEGRTTIDENDQVNEEGEPTNKRSPYTEKSSVCKRQRLQKDENKLLQMACEHLKQSSDSTNIMAKVWASQYSEMPNQQQIHARKIISDILFHGCLGHLNQDVVNDIENIFNQYNTRSATSTPIWLNESSISSPIPPTQTILFDENQATVVLVPTTDETHSQKYRDVRSLLSDPDFQ